MLQNVITSAMDWTVTTEQGIEYLENFHYLNAREFLKRVLDKKTDMIWRRLVSPGGGEGMVTMATMKIRMTKK